MAVRNAAKLIFNLKDMHLADFLKRKLYKTDRLIPISVTEKKIAVIL